MFDMTRSIASSRTSATATLSRGPEAAPATKPFLKRPVTVLLFTSVELPNPAVPRRVVGYRGAARVRVPVDRRRSRVSSDPVPIEFDDRGHQRDRDVAVAVSRPR